MPEAVRVAQNPQRAPRIGCFEDAVRAADIEVWKNLRKLREEVLGIKACEKRSALVIAQEKALM